jgi:hypothetical protein
MKDSEDNVNVQPFHFTQEARGITERLLDQSVGDDMNSRQMKKDNESYTVSVIA